MYVPRADIAFAARLFMRTLCCFAAIMSCRLLFTAVAAALVLALVMADPSSLTSCQACSSLAGTWCVASNDPEDPNGVCGATTTGPGCIGFIDWQSCPIRTASSITCPSACAAGCDEVLTPENSYRGSYTLGGLDLWPNSCAGVIVASNVQVNHRGTKQRNQ